MTTPELRKSDTGKRPGCVNFYIVVAVIGAFLLVLVGLSHFLGDTLFISSPNAGSSILAIIIGAALAAAAAGLFLMRDWARWLVIGLHGVFLVLTVVVPLVASGDDGGVSDVVEVSEGTRLLIDIVISFLLNLIVIYWFSTSTEEFS